MCAKDAAMCAKVAAMYTKDAGHVRQGRCLYAKDAEDAASAAHPASVRPE